MCSAFSFKLFISNVFYIDEMQDNTKTVQFLGCHSINCVSWWVQTG